MSRASSRFAVMGVLLAASACASAPTAPAGGGARYADFAAPEIPAGLRVTQEIRDRQASAWQRLQAGDLRGASRVYTELLKRSPAFYPAEAGLGVVALAERQYRTAVTRFRSTLGRDNRYVPAWRGLVEAELGAGNTDEAIAALERLLALDGTRESDRTRLELLRLKQVQALVQAGVRAREGGRLKEADDLFRRALALSPLSPMVFRELAELEILAGQLDQAEAHARRAVTLDPADASAHGVLASVLQARGRTAEAAAALSRAAAIDPETWRARAEAARAGAGNADLPAEMAGLAGATTVTRGQLAALIGTHLEALIAKSPRRLPEVATDIRGHWAARWIISVTQAGIMDVFANHTFQPGASVRRADLADLAGELLTLAMTGRTDQLARWQSERPAFEDVGASHLFYRRAALAVAAGVMSTESSRFHPTRPATGAEALAAVARIQQLMAR